MAEKLADDGNEPIIALIDEVDATEYSIGVSIPDNAFKLEFHNQFGMLSSFVTDSAGAYELAQRILRGYDKLEGL